MRRGAETVYADTFGIARGRQRPVADQSGAQQRGGLRIGIVIGQRETIILVGSRVFRVTAVQRVAGETRLVAQVLAPAQAKAAMPAGVAQPGHAQPLPDGEALDLFALGDHDADDLVAGYQRQFRLGEFAVQDVQVGAAHAAGADLEQHLVVAARGRRQFDESQGRVGFFQNHCAHVVPLVLSKTLATPYSTKEYCPSPRTKSMCHLNGTAANCSRPYNEQRNWDR